MLRDLQRAQLASVMADYKVLEDQKAELSAAMLEGSEDVVGPLVDFVSMAKAVGREIRELGAEYEKIDKASGDPDGVALRVVDILKGKSLVYKLMPAANDMGGPCYICRQGIFPRVLLQVRAI